MQVQTVPKRLRDLADSITKQATEKRRKATVRIVGRYTPTPEKSFWADRK